MSNLMPSFPCSRADIYKCSLSLYAKSFKQFFAVGLLLSLLYNVGCTYVLMLSLGNFGKNVNPIDYYSIVLLSLVVIAFINFAILIPAISNQIKDGQSDIKQLMITSFKKMPGLFAFCVLSITICSAVTMVIVAIGVGVNYGLEHLVGNSSRLLEIIVFLFVFIVSVVLFLFYNFFLLSGPVIKVSRNKSIIGSLLCAIKLSYRNLKRVLTTMPLPIVIVYFIAPMAVQFSSGIFLAIFILLGQYQYGGNGIDSLMHSPISLFALSFPFSLLFFLFSMPYMISVVMVMVEDLFARDELRKHYLPISKVVNEEAIEPAIEKA